MTLEIVPGPLDEGKPSRRRYRWGKRDGERVRIRVIDADSPTLGADLLDMFRENVRRVLHEQRKAAREAKISQTGSQQQG